LKTSTVIVGLQWGDEGKGKIVDFLSQKVDYVVRFNGGNNAGHTVSLNGQQFKFHHLPSGAISGKKLLIGQGEVINPKILLEEISYLEKQKIKVDLLIDFRTHIVMPYHQALDAATERWKGEKATGSLKLGIGYCYEDKNNRLGIRLEDLVRPEILAQKIKEIFPLKKAIIEKVFGQKVNIGVSQIVEEYTKYGQSIKKYEADVSAIVNYYLGKKKFLFESAHGTFLDPAFGTYPFTVAPSCLSGAVFSSVGFGPVGLDVIGVVKAYTTRVGNGPFVTEQKNKSGEIMQKVGQEIGTTSGRVRRCGWLDLPMLKNAVMWNGCRQLVLTKLDVLSQFPKIPICTHYLFQKKKYEYFPPEINRLPKCQPVYKELKGWNVPISKIKNYQDLPKECRRYVEFIEKELKVPIIYISNGRERGEMICKRK
jgi:adenylosuccinate synthase